MISSSQISLVHDNSRQVSSSDSSQLRINRQLPGTSQTNGNANGSELVFLRQADYRFSSQEQVEFSGSSTINKGGQQNIFTSARLTEKTTDLLLAGQEALSVSRAALGGDAGVEARGSLSVTAGRYLFYSEDQSRSFTSTGSISLENGETIDFTLSLRQSQSRSYEYSELVQIQERPLTDPLVINFGNATARLTDTLFEFDLNSNGESSQFATLGSGSGYLVLDRNGNGKVDNGSEMFGPQSGSGFGELARFDDDGNRWIDANDAIFSALSVWTQKTDGSQVLRSLEEVGVQALYVDNVQDRFTLTNSQGVPLGQIKGSGIYLTTDGEVRTLEEIDLAEQKTSEVPAAETVLRIDPGTRNQGAPDSGGRGWAEARNEAIRSALEKLNEIREKQKAFIEDTKAASQPKSPIDDYLKLIDKLRLELLNSQDEKKQAASRYLEFANLGKSQTHRIL